MEDLKKLTSDLLEYDLKLKRQIKRLKAANSLLRAKLNGASIDPLDLKKAGIPNIVFGYAGSIRDGQDDRESMWKEQRMEMGFDDTELWGLDSTIAQFIVPRLERLTELNIFGIKDKSWFTDLDDFLFAMKKIAEDRIIPNSPDEARIKKGMEAFPRIFRGLWF